MNAQPATAAFQKRLGAFCTGEPTADPLVSKQVLQRLAEGADGNFEKVEIVDQFLPLEAKFDASSGCSWEPRLSSNDEDAET